jgi:hypothetical protein
VTLNDVDNISCSCSYDLYYKQKDGGAVYIGNSNYGGGSGKFTRVHFKGNTAGVSNLLFSHTFYYLLEHIDIYCGSEKAKVYTNKMQSLSSIQKHLFGSVSSRNVF